jgi:hypothetical protein
MENMKKYYFETIILIIIISIISACKPSKTPIAQNGKNDNSTGQTPNISPVVPENGTAILVYQQETHQEPAFSEVLYIEIPIQMVPSKGESRDMIGSKDGDMHIACAPKGAVECHMFFTLTVKITAQGIFDPKKCAFNILVSGVPGNVTERLGNCPLNPERLFTDSMVQSHFIPPLDEIIELKGGSLSKTVDVVKNTKMTLTLKDVYLPNVVSCQW